MTLRRSTGSSGSAGPADRRVALRSRPQPHSVGSQAQGSNPGYPVWAPAIYPLMTSLTSVSSMKLHQDLDIPQNSAWHTSRPIQAALPSARTGFSDPVE